MFNENKAGQPYTAKWYYPIASEKGQEQRMTTIPSVFWCAQITAEKSSRSFRDGLQGATYSAVLQTTNVSKLVGIRELGGKILYDGGLRNIVYSELSVDKRIYTIAIE